MKRYALLLATFLCCTFLWGQSFEPKFINMSVEEGFPSSEVHDVYLDKKNCLWFATDRGVVCYDSDRFEVFTIKDGLADQVVLKFHPVSEDEVILTGIDPRMSILTPSKRSIVKHPVNGQLMKLKEGIQIPHSVLKEGGDIVVSYYSAEHFLKIKGEKVEKYPASHGYTISEVGEKGLFATRNNSKEQNSRVLGTGRLNIDLNADEVSSRKYSHFYAVQTDNGDVFFSVGNQLFFSVGEGVQSQTFKDEIISLTIDSKGQVWVGFRNSGVLNYIDNRFYLSGYSVTKVCRDYQGGYWFSTLESGLFYAPTLGISSILSNRNNHVTSIARDGNRLLSGHYDGTYAEIELARGQLELKRNLCFGSWEPIYVMKRREGGFLFSDKSVVREHFWGEESKGLKIPELHLFGVREQEDRSYRIYDESEVAILDDEFKELDAYQCQARKFDVLTIDGVDYLATSQGLLAYENGESISIGDDALLYERAEFLVEQDGDLWVGTIGNGLFVFDPERKKVVTHLTMEMGLPSENVNCVLIDERQLWVGTSRGLALYDRKDGELKFNREIGLQHGLTSNEITAISKYEGTLLVATKSGLNALEIEEVLRDESFSFSLITARMGSIDFEMDKQHVFPSYQNGLEVSFKLIDFRNDKKRYRYKLEGYHHGWLETTDNLIRVDNLSHGKYRLFIQYDVPGIGWRNVYQAEHALVIDRAFFQEAWFIILVLALFLIMLYFMLQRVITKVKERKDTEMRVVELELKALRAQMNPHFTFNSINSIQDFILDKQPIVAHQYLSKFSKLIRNTLDFSRAECVSVEDIIGNLELYIELEKMRFDDPFSHEIACPKELKELCIPPLIIQPFIENAIWHGLKPLKHSGNLVVRFHKRDEWIFIEIEDDGVGVGEEKRKVKHVSHGISIIKERLRHYNSQEENIFIDSQVGKGTRVKIQIKL